MQNILTSLYGRIFGRTSDDRILASKGFLSGDYGDQIALADLRTVQTFDDFDGSILANKWQVAKGSDGGAANFALNGGISGTALGTTGAGAGATYAANGIQIASNLNFKAQGSGGATATNNLEFNTRVQLSAITNVALFVGFTNEVGTLQMPINGAGGGNGFTANANDAVGFLFDTTMTSAHWWAIGAKAGVATAGQDSGMAPAAAAYDTLAVSVDQLGNAVFFLNKQQVGVIAANSITPTVGLTPVIAAFSRAAASRNVTLDRIVASMNRI